MRTQALVFLMVLAAILPTPAAAACDWTVDLTWINNSGDAAYSTNNDLDTPAQDGVSGGHTTHDCGMIHQGSGLSNYATIASWPAWAAGSDYANVIYRIINENGSIVATETQTKFFPTTGNSATITNLYHVLNGSHNYTVQGLVYFVDSGGPNSFYDANGTMLWESNLNSVAPVVTFTHPLDGHSETEIISATVDVIDAIHPIFDVNGAVMVATNTADPGAGNFSGPSISASGWVFVAGDSWAKTIDMENDGDSEWNTGGHPIDGTSYKICAWARNDPLQQSDTTCVNFTFTSAGGPPGGPGGTGVLRGYIFDNETGVPYGLTGVLATLPDIGWSTTTSKYGEFIFTDVPIDNYTIRLQKSGYVALDIYQLWDHSDNNTFAGVHILERSELPQLFEPMTDEEIQLALRTYIPFLFFLAVGAFATIILVETNDSIIGPRRYRRGRY